MFEIGLELIYNDTIIQRIIDTTTILNYKVFVVQLKNSRFFFSIKGDSIILFINGFKTYLYKGDSKFWSDKVGDETYKYTLENDSFIRIRREIYKSSKLKLIDSLIFTKSFLSIRRIIIYPYNYEYKLSYYKSPTIEKILNFLLKNVNEYGTFLVYEKFRYGTIETYISTYHNAFGLDVLRNLKFYKSKLKDSLEKILLNSILKYKKPGGIWTYWIDREIAPDFDDISIHSLVLKLYDIPFEKNDTLFKKFFKTDKNCYLTWLGDSIIPIRWLGSIINNKDCDCIVNLNIFRYLGDKNLCSYLNECYKSLNNMKDKWYLDPLFWFFYFYSKSSYKCQELNISKDVELLLKEYDRLSFRQLVLLLSSANIMNIRNLYFDLAREKLKHFIQNDGGMPFMFYTPDNFNRILPTFISIDAFKF